MRILSLITVMLFVSSLAAPARAGMVADCNQESDPELRISGCTAVIHSGEYSGEDLAAAYNNRGFSYDDLGEYRLAIKDFDEALRLDPNYAYAYNNRGVAYDNLGEHRRAIQDYDQALRFDPGYAIAYNSRGNAYELLGEHRRAIEDFNEALRLDPGYGNAYQNRGVAYENLGDYDHAARDWEQAIRIDGASRARWWQEYMKARGHYSGAIDGIFDPGTRADLLACARDPNC